MLRKFCFWLRRHVTFLAEIDRIPRVVAAAPLGHCSVDSELVDGKDGRQRHFRRTWGRVMYGSAFTSITLSTPLGKKAEHLNTGCPLSAKCCIIILAVKVLFSSCLWIMLRTSFLLHLD